MYSSCPSSGLTITGIRPLHACCALIQNSCQPKKTPAFRSHLTGGFNDRLKKDVDKIVNKIKDAITNLQRLQPTGWALPLPLPRSLVYEKA
jgi:hypothetical protein